MAAIPSALWKAYWRDMIRARPDRGAHAASYDLRQLKKGGLRATLLYRKRRAVGFTLHPKVTRAGVEANTLYVTPGNRSHRAFREVMSSLVEEGPVFTVTAWSPGLSPRVMNPVLRGLGFRRVRRAWLYLDPSAERGSPELNATPKVRALRRSDEGELARLTIRAYTHHIDSAFGPGGDVRVWGPSYVHELFKDRRRPIDFGSSFVCVRGDRIVGDVIVVTGDEGPHVMDLSVDPRRRGMGLGYALMRCALDALASRRVSRADLSVSVDNPTGALQLYRKLGFRRVPGPPRWPGIWIHERTRRRMRLRVRGE